MSKKKQSRTTKTPRQAQPKADRTVPRREQQLALIGDTVLDIEAAFRILHAAPRRTVRIDVDAWARLYGMDGNPAAPIRLGPLFDPEHARHADLTKPLILVTFTTAGGDEVILIADGSHRLYRAFTQGRDHLPAWILTTAETASITATGAVSTIR